MAALIVKRHGHVSSATEFVTKIFDLRRADQKAKFLYRGQPNALDRLVPTAGREYKYAGRTKSFSPTDERNLLHRFRRRAYPHAKELKAGEALFLARHHRLPTRLLDWTANALYGLYFACIEHLDVTGTIWVLRQRELIEDPLEPFKLARYSEHRLFCDPGGKDRVKVVFPIFNSPRIVAQEGVFTFHTNPKRALDDYEGEEFEAADMDVVALHCWCIGAEDKGNIIRDLSGLGINHRVVFPDLDGIAQSLWETEVLWNGQEGRK